MSRTVVLGMGAVAFGAVVVSVGVACGSFDSSEETGRDGGTGDGSPATPTDGPSNTDGGGTDAGGDGGAVDAGPFARKVLTTSIVEPWYLTVSDPYVLVTSHAVQPGDVKGGVFRMNKADGTGFTRIGLRKAWGLWAGSTNLYFCNYDANDEPGLVQVPIAGGPNTVRASAPCLEVAQAGSEIYYTRGRDAGVERVTTDGGVLVANAAAPEGIINDGSSVFYTELHGARISTVTGNGPPSKVSDTNAEPRRIARKNDWLYWVEYTSRKVQRVTTSGANRQDISEGPANVKEGGIAVDDTHVYWVVTRNLADGGGGLYRAPSNGGPAEVLADNLDFPVDVALDDDFAYVTVRDAGVVLRISKTAAK